MSDITKAKQRDSNLELFRIVAMLMIVALHYLNPYMGGALANAATGTANYYFAYALESLCIIGPNCFVLIAGYFMAGKTSVCTRKAFELYINMVFYALAFYFLVSRLAPALMAPGVTWSRLLTPFVTGDRWFVKAYLILYILAPFLNRGLSALSKNGYRRLLLILLCLFSLWYSFWDGAPAVDGGYGFINFILLYCIAGYIRLHGSGIKITPGLSAALFALCAAATFAAKLTFAEPKAWAYSFISNIAGSVFLFLAFKGFKINHSRLINGLAASTFGVFLIHSDISLVYVLYRKLLNTSAYWNSPLLPVHAIFSVVAVFCVSAAIDKIRALVFSFTVDPVLDRIPFVNRKIDSAN